MRQQASTQNRSGTRSWPTDSYSHHGLESVGPEYQPGGRAQIRSFALGGTLITCRRHRHPQRRGIDDISFLCSASGSPVQDFRNLLDAVICNLLIGNNEAHAKNFALLYVIDGQRRLAPLYDLACTVYYSQIENHLTMKIGREAKTQIAIAFEQRFIVND